ncbi:hypothetical protein A1Y1_03140 [Escherichia coli KTE115]|jgi:putative transposase|uniref:Integrase core protein n=1 Tax=Escherichia coli DORA_A_5_14_21 TaxID=1403943 RepID=W1W4F9_ECOLX|nr:hypothetical protein A1Y1_03140 [Escherichia coli KTE115]ETJ11214.1 MAG: Integrase core protein [Escherichia coli DORA_A_5_14_21]SYX10416.1 Uncharacterised protein [Escherichia coli]BBR86872.1 hypothetical protein WP4S18E07_07680 [Escherichia coli]GCX15047.1 IS1400 transposase [Escherichia coli]
MNPLLPPCRPRLSDIRYTAFRSFSRFCDGKDTRGITRIYCLLKLNFSRRANNDCRYAIPHHWLHRKRRTIAGLSILCMMLWPVAVVFIRSMSLMALIVRRYRLKIDLNLPALRVVRVLGRIAANCGYPVMQRMDSGLEFISWRWLNGQRYT